jgi:microcystin-dependent protein
MARDNFRDTLGISDTATTPAIFKPLAGLEVRVYLPGTTTLVNIFGTRNTAVTTPLTQPLVTPVTGIIDFWANSGEYDINIKDPTVPARIAEQTFGWNATPMSDGGIPGLKIANDGGLGAAAFAAAVQQALYSPGDLRFTLATVSAANQPAGWLYCDGRAVSRTTYAALFAAIGTKAGVGDNSTTFNLPDGQGRAAVGAGSGSGLTPRNAGDKFGEENHILSVAEIPQTTPHRWSNNVTAAGPDAQVYLTGGNDVANEVGPGAGGGGSHNNIQPSFFAYWLIKI